MNNTHTFHSFSGFSLIASPQKHNETLSLERKRNPKSTGFCCCRCIFPFFSPSCLSSGLHIFSGFTFSLFVVLFTELTLLMPGSFRMESYPGGGSGSRLRKVCVWECVSVCVRVSVWPTGHPCTEGPLCMSPVYNTYTFLYSALLERRSVSLQPLPILPTDTFMCTYTFAHAHIYMYV